MNSIAFHIGTFLKLIAITTASLTFTTLRAAEVDAKLLEERIQGAVAKALPATVSVMEARAGRAGVFSGVLVSSDGYILSAAHAVTVGMNYKIQLSDGRTAKAIGLGMNRKIDCALIKIQDAGEWPFVEMGHSSRLEKDQPVIAIGFPGAAHAGQGAVVRLGRVIQPVSSRFGMILSTALMEPGDSGGGLFDLDGRVVGIRSQIQQSLDENFDIPVDSFQQYWDELKKGEEFQVDRVPGLPNLGFEARRSRRMGIRVQSVEPDGVAARAGLQEGDLITQVEGNHRGWMLDRITSQYLSGDRSIELTIDRGEKTEVVCLNFEESPTTTESDTTQTASSEIHDPLSTPSLNRTATLFGAIESKLDDAVVSLRSDKFGRERVIRGTAIDRTGYLISKNSMIGEDIQVQNQHGDWLPARIIARNPENDLALLHCANQWESGLNLSSSKTVRPGALLISPSSDGLGLLSITGSRPFRIPKDEGRGYLGVVLGQDEEGVIIEEVMDGAAKRAGIEKGDHLLRLNGQEIKVRENVYSLLRDTVPEDLVTAVVKREDEELEKKITLGEVIKNPRHIAEDFQGGKSLRRDGFPEIFCHDAVLLPEQCGGPVYDTHGNWVGINIARFSRTLCLAIPAESVIQFVKSNLPDATQ